METTVARIERLECNNRRMAATLAVLTVLFACAIVEARSASSKLTAQSLRITDSAGRERIVIGGTPSGGVLSLYDSRERMRVGVVASRDKSGARIFNSAQEPVANLTEDRELVGVDFEAGKYAMFFGTTAGAPGITMLGNGTAKLSLADGQSPSVIFFDKDDKQRIGIGQMQDGTYKGFVAGHSADSSDYTMP